MSDAASSLITPEFSLYPYQRQVVRDVLRALDLPERRVVAHLPTGAGKTRIAAHVACRLLNDDDDERSLVIWLASTEELCDQAAEALSVGWKHLGSREASVHRYWGSSSIDLRSLSTGFLVTGLAKLHATASNDHTLLAALASQTTAVVFDEAHQAIAETYSFITEQLCSSRPPLLGLTATPGRTAVPTESDYRLAEMFSRRKVAIDPRGHDSPVTYLIHNLYLAKPRFVQFSIESDVTVREPVPGNDYRQQDLNALGEDRQRTRCVVEVAVNAVKRHSRTIVFCPSVNSAKDCNRLLRCEGFTSHVVTANTPSDERRAIIDAFRGRTTEHMILFNYGVLTAGFDAPQTSCVIVARPTTSLVLYSQMVGRALRGLISGGNRNAEIVTIIDLDLPGFGSVTEAFTNWEEIWSTN